MTKQAVHYYGKFIYWGEYDFHEKAVLECNCHLLGFKINEHGEVYPFRERFNDQELRARYYSESGFVCRPFGNILEFSALSGDMKSYIARHCERMGCVLLSNGQIKLNGRRIEPETFRKRLGGGIKFMAAPGVH